jgi:glycosyltransferase involved in cell wall biosynthesis
VLLGQQDIWHLHWPDHQVAQEHSVEVAVRVSALAGLLRAAKARGIRIVWTAHNTASHEKRHLRLERLLWQAVCGSVDGVIALSEAGVDRARETHPRLAQVPFAVIPHGHYRDVYGPPVDQQPARARLGLPASGRIMLHLGRIRPYKNVPGLVQAFAAAGLADTTLVIAGNPADATVQRAIDEASAGVRDLVLRLTFVSDEEIALYLAASDLVVLPFTEISNSGSAILGLSFDRPIIVPRQGAMCELAQWYGPEWVRTYGGGLTPDVIRRLVASPLPAGPLDMPQLAWPAIADQTEMFYEQLLGTRPNAPARPGRART